MEAIDFCVREKCKDCEGEGMVMHPIWQRFLLADNAHEKEHGDRMSQEQAIKWFLENCNRTQSDLPPEEITCPGCSGSGGVEYWVDAQELFAVLLKNNQENENLRSE